MLLNAARYLGRRVFTWFFRTEIYMFLSISGFLLIFCVLESILHPDESVETIDVIAIPNETNIQTSNDELTPSMIENMSTFIPSVIGLFIALFVIWKIAVILLFGDLRASERAPLSKSLFRFVIFRFIILSGSINPARLTSLFGWLAWFTFLGLLHMLISIFTSRCNQLSASGSVSLRQWLRMSLSFLVIFVGDWLLLLTGLDNCFLLSDIDISSKSDVSGPSNRKSFLTGFMTPTVLSTLKAKVTGKKQIYDTVDVIALLLAEFALVMCPLMHLVSGLLIQAYDRWRLSKGRGWTNQATITSYSELIFVCLHRIIEITHYLHLLLWSRVFSVASLVVFLHMRVSYSSLTNCISHYLSQQRLSKYITENYQLCTSNDSNDLGRTKESSFLQTNETNFESDDNIFKEKTENLAVCAICWDTMKSWRRLPCHHDFHEHCLRSWMEQNPSCPTCRRSLDVPPAFLGVNNRNNQPNRHDGDVNEPRPFMQPNNISGISRLFTLGLNLGLSIGTTHVLTAASQTTTTTTTLPRNSSNTANSSESTNSTSQAYDNSTVSEAPPSDAQSTQQNINDNNTNNRITRRSFHFDGTRYFSWLPFLHVELSEVFREVLHIGGVHDFNPNSEASLLAINNESNTMPTNTTNFTSAHVPPTLQVAVEQLTEMFPQFPRTIIINELLATGVPEMAAENLISRPAPSTSHISQTPSSSVDNTSNNTETSAINTQLNRRNQNVDSPSTSHNLSNGPSDDLPEEFDPEDNSFATRRRIMLAKARRSFLLKHSS